MWSWKQHLLKPGSKPRIGDTRPPKNAPDREKAEEMTTKTALKIAEYQELLYAAGTHSILLLLQGMDGSGKDGTVRKVLGPVNPAGVNVTSFKAPTSRELAQDFLWRAHIAAPPRGTIAVFNRTYYEDVLIVRVHADKLLPRHLRKIKNPWKQRYSEILQFEGLLTAANTRIMKCFLNISNEEQRDRFLDRQKEPDKQHKLTIADIQERTFWPVYMKTYEEVLSKTSTKENPWLVVPSDAKWYRNLVVSQAILEEFKSINPKPPGAADPEVLKMEIK